MGTGNWAGARLQGDKGQVMVVEITWQRRAGDAQPYSGEDLSQGFASKRRPGYSGAAWPLHWKDLPYEAKLFAFNSDAPGSAGDMSHGQHCTLLLVCEMLLQQ